MIDFQYLVDYYNQLPMLVKLVWCLISLLVIVIIVFLVYLKYLRSHLRAKELLTKKLFADYEANLINFLYAGNNEIEVSNEQQKIIDKMIFCVEDKFKRGIFISVLSKLKDEISGEMADDINNLFLKTGLINYSLKKLNSRKWDHIASGIKELTQFEMTNVYDEVSKLENHEKQEVRNEVQLYYVNLFQFKGLEFLNNLKSPISEWNQIQLLEILQKFDDQEISDITPWLKSKNDSVVLFALKLAKIYNQFQVIDILLTLLSHKTKEIKVSALEVLSYFQVKETKPIIKHNFSERSIEEQISFFKMLMDVADSDDEDFIINNTNHPNFEIKLMAFTLLKKLNTEKLQSIKRESLNIESEKIFNYLEVN